MRECHSRRWMKFKERAHIGQIGIHVAVDQCCRAINEESPALPALLRTMHVLMVSGGGTVWEDLKCKRYISLGSTVFVHVGVG